MTAKYVVNLWDTTGANRARGTLKASIPDAKDIGVSAYANEGGEMFFTLPWNHAQVGECVPKLRHYQVLRFNGSTYDVMGVGLLDDISATKDEVVVYGIDYMGVWDSVITANATSYTGQFVGTILSTEISATIGGGNSRLGFLTQGTIDTTSKTTTVITSYEAKSHFFGGLLDILMEGNTTRPLISITRASPFTITFDDNAGVDRNDLRLEFGGLINDFAYEPGWRDYFTNVYAIGQRREGATVLYSNQSNGGDATYGAIQTPRVFIDIVNQVALDDKASTEAKNLARIPKALALRLAQGELVPYDGWTITDSLPVYIDRGVVSVNDLFTAWGFEWIGKRDGSEDLFLDLQPKDT